MAHVGTFLASEAIDDGLNGGRPASLSVNLSFIAFQPDFRGPDANTQFTTLLMRYYLHFLRLVPSGIPHFAARQPVQFTNRLLRHRQFRAPLMNEPQGISITLNPFVSGPK